MSSADEKNVIRKKMKKLRYEIPINYYRIWSDSIMKKCINLEEWFYAQTVHIYVSALNNEVDTLGLIYKMFDDRRKKVVVPKCNTELHTIINIHIESFDELSPTKFNLMEPDYITEKESNPEKLNLIIAPLLAFDRLGGRLGFGKGYYDNLFNKCKCPKVGLGYSFQEVDKVPMEPQDEKLDIIITENETIRVKHE